MHSTGIGNTIKVTLQSKKLVSKKLTDDAMTPISTLWAFIGFHVYFKDLIGLAL